MVKFSSKIDADVLDALREYAHAEGRTLSWVLSEAVRHYLARAAVRPVVQNAIDSVLDENAELLDRLAQ